MCICVYVLHIQLCPTLCDPMNCSLPGSSVHGILQARIWEWVAIPFSGRSSQPRDQTHHLLHLLHCLAGSLPPAPPGKPGVSIVYLFSLLLLLNIHSFTFEVDFS